MRTGTRRDAELRCRAAIAAGMLVMAYGVTGTGPAVAQSHQDPLESATMHATGLASNHRLESHVLPRNAHDVFEEIPGLSLALSAAQPSLRTDRAVAASGSVEGRAIILAYHHVDTTTPREHECHPRAILKPPRPPGLGRLPGDPACRRGRGASVRGIAAGARRSPDLRRCLSVRVHGSLSATASTELAVHSVRLHRTPWTGVMRTP